MERKKGILIAVLAVLCGTGFWGTVGQPSAQAGQTLDLSGNLVQDIVYACGFVTNQPVSYLGTIVGSQDASANLSEGDLIYIKLKDGQKVKPGDHLAIGRLSKEISHPVTKKKFGNALYFPGRVVILDGNGPVVPAKIEKSFAPVVHGDFIMTPPPPPQLAVPIRLQEKVKGVILAAVEEEWNITDREVVFIDRGMQDGVIVGDLFSIFTLPYYTKEASEDKEKLPLLKVGEGVVVSLTPETSTLLVTKSSQAIYAGDTVMSGKGK
jgi:hypothetical protein